MSEPGRLDRRQTSPMLQSVSRFALLISFVLVGCPVPTPVGELQQAGAGSGATSTSEGTSEGPVSSTSSSTSSTSLGPTGSSTASVTASSSGDSVVAQMTSFAIRRGDLPDDEPTDTIDTISGVDTGSFGDPDDLLVTFGFTSANCEDPNASDSCGTWSATLTLSPEQQVTGTYTDAEVDGFFVEQGPSEGSEDCFGTGGSLEGFTIILESIDETGLEMVFEGDGIGPDGVDLNGLSLTVPRC